MSFCGFGDSFIQWIKTIYNENVYYGKDVWPSMVSHGRMHTIVCFFYYYPYLFHDKHFKLYFTSHDLFMLIFIQKVVPVLSKTTIIGVCFTRKYYLYFSTSKCHV